MAIGLIWLVIEVGVGIAVLVRCFVNEKNMEAKIVDRLGNGFSRAPFATVVAVCTAVSLLACVPLSELFFFHTILIRKGITTYEYVVAMRAMSEAQPGASVDEELQTMSYSPTGSATTGFSSRSSLGLQYKGAWCTPPRVFVDYQEEVAPQLEPGMIPSTVDPDAPGFGEKGNKAPKRPVRISAWKLAKLDSNKAMRVAAKARASSSVLRPLHNRQLPDYELSRSGNMSVRSSMSTDTAGNKDIKNELRFSPLQKSLAPCQGSPNEYETGTQSVSSFSSPSHVHESVTLSPLPQAHDLSHFGATSSVPGYVLEQPLASKTAFLTVNNPLSQDENIIEKGRVTDPLLLSAPAPGPVPATSLLRDIKRTSVVWDSEAGRYVSVALSASEARNRPLLQTGVLNRNAGSGVNDNGPAVPPREQPSSKRVRQSEKLMYTGESIFFGGPLLSVPNSDGSRNVKGGSGSQEGQGRVLLNLPRESRFKRDVGSNQLPVFIPFGFEQNRPSGLVEIVHDLTPKGTIIV